MSEKETKKKVKKSNTKVKSFFGWTFTLFVVAQIIFYSGVWYGTQATLNSQAHEAQVKTQAVEEYKASLESK